MILAAFDRMAVLNTSLGCTMALLIEPTDTTVILVGSFFVFKQTMMNCSRSSDSNLLSPSHRHHEVMKWYVFDKGSSIPLPF